MCVMKELTSKRGVGTLLEKRPPCGGVAGSGNSKPLVQPVFVHVLSAAPISRQVNCRGGDYFRMRNVFFW